MFKKRVKLAQSMGDFEAQAVDFLQDNGFPITPEFLKLYGTLIQHSSENDDTFSPSELAKKIRKLRANEFAFYLVHPERKPKDDKEEEAQPRSVESEVAIET